MKVAILGCGPAGLMAAHAAHIDGHVPVIYSRKVESKMFGAMYLHKAIELINDPEPDFYLDVWKYGDGDGYRHKVYGHCDHPVSFDNYEVGKVAGWDLRVTYQMLWDVYSTFIEDVELGTSELADIYFEHAVVLSTIPATALCRASHNFHSHKIWVLHGEDQTLYGPANIMIYNGDRTVPWYRYSQLGKYQSWEYASDPKDLGLRLSVFNLEKGTKPIHNDCDCPPPNVHRLGRFGQWQKGVLTHHAFEEAKTIIREEARALH